MKKEFCLALWGGLFIVCAALGFIPEPQGALKTLMTLLSLCFFVPPAVLLYRGQALVLIRNLALASLGLSLALLVVNFLSVLSSPVLGNLVYHMLIIVSSPMVAMGHWALSLFLWACLLLGSLKKYKTQGEV